MRNMKQKEFFNFFKYTPKMMYRKKKQIRFVLTDEQNKIVLKKQLNILL